MAGFLELAILIGFATTLAALLYYFKQPTIVAYIIAGLILGPIGLNAVQDPQALESFSKLGIAFLLFLVGLELNLKSLKEIGKIATVTGIGQMLFCTILGFIIGKLLGYPDATAFFLALAFAFSSTVIVVKLLSDKGELDSLHGKIAVGFLLIQDLIAIAALLFLSSTNTISLASIGLLILKLIIIIGIIIAASKTIVPWLARKFSRSTELIFLFAVSWCFLLAAAFETFGFSVEIGALMAGVSLSGTLFVREIESKVKPLRDLFIVLFFLFLGAQLELNASVATIIPAIVYSLFIILITPIVVMLLMKAMHFSKRTGFLLGTAVSQVSEFSLLLLFLAFKQGYITKDAVGIGTLVGIITILISTYLISHSENIYQKISPYLKIFGETQEKNTKITSQSQYFLIGCGRAGKEILSSMDATKTTVIDFDPQIIASLNKNKINAVYGDVSDLEFIKSVNFSNAQILLATTTNKNANHLLLKEVKKQSKNAIVILTAETAYDAIDLYDAGADYIILPHLVGGTHAAMMLEKYHTHGKSKIVKQRDAHKKELSKLTKGTN